MLKALNATQSEFESSCSRTPEYLSWHRLFKREFTKFLTEHGATLVQIGKPNHFDMSGFFTWNGQAWYFSIGDLRGFKDTMLVRTAQHYKDYTGGQNHFVPLNMGTDHFDVEFRRVVEGSSFR
jgi:hypothetical protein